MRRLFLSAGLAVCNLNTGYADTVGDRCNQKYPVIVNYSTNAKPLNGKLFRLDINVKVSFNYANGLACEDFSLMQQGNFRLENNHSCVDVVSGQDIDGKTSLTDLNHTKYEFDQPHLADLRTAFIIYDTVCNEAATRPDRTIATIPLTGLSHINP